MENNSVLDDILALNPCCHDELFARLLKRYPTKDALLGPECQAILWALAEKLSVDVAEIEATHSSIRDFSLLRSRGWLSSLESLSARFILQQLAKDRGATRNSASDGIGRERRAKARKETKRRGGGGAWRAFLARNLRGKPFAAKNLREAAVAYRALSAEDKQYYQDLGGLATRQHRAGGRGFGAPAREPLPRQPADLPGALNDAGAMVMQNADDLLQLDFSGSTFEDKFRQQKDALARQDDSLALSIPEQTALDLQEKQLAGTPADDFQLQGHEDVVQAFKQKQLPSSKTLALTWRAPALSAAKALLHPSSLGRTKKYALQKNLQQAWSKRSGPPHSVPEDAEEAEECSPREREAEHLEYIHVGYFNFSSWHFSCLRVHEFTDATAWGVPSSEHQDSIQVMVRTDVDGAVDKTHGVFTDVQFASKFLDLNRSCFLQVYCISLCEDLWQKQDTSSKLVPLVPLPGLHEMKIWRGWEFEKQEMQRLSKEKRKRTASDMPLALGLPRAKKARGGGPAQPGLPAGDAEPQQPSEGVDDQQYADINEHVHGYARYAEGEVDADEGHGHDEDEDEHQGDWLQDVASHHSCSSRDPEDFDEDDQCESEDDGAGVGPVPGADVAPEAADVHLAGVGDELWDEIQRDFADADALGADGVEARAAPALARGVGDVFELPGQALWVQGSESQLRLYIVLFRKDKFSRETVATFKRTVEAIMQYVEANFPPKPLTELMLAPESPLLQELLAAQNAKKSQA
ncbi:unnamed protein product, partial [Symbiodinium sp. KB8]